MNTKTILLVEDNPSDIELTKRALANANIANKLVVAEDGQEALDYLFGTGHYAGRDAAPLLAVVLLDLKLPKVDGLDILRRIRANERTKRLPVVILTSSQEEQDIALVMTSAPTATSKNRLTFSSLQRPSRLWDFIG